MNDIYSAPESKLMDSSEGDIDNFTRFSAWGVFGLSIITFGVYIMYWFVTRTVRLNEFSEHKISMNLVYTTLIVYVAYTAISFIDESLYDNDLILFGSLGVMFLYLGLYLTWIFSFRSRLLDIAVSHGKTDFKVNPVLTFFFQALYLQYKINSYIDQKQNLDI